jgi:uncharacterized membrane protein YozB (DUF420 family)
MKIRRVIAAVTGVAQEAIGLLSAILAALLFFDVLGVQAVFNLPAEFLPLYLLILVVFSIFSVVSGLFLIREGQKRT